MLYEQVKNLLRCQTLMPVDRDGRGADGKRLADVGFFAPGADGDLVFELGLNNGALITVPVTYVTGGGLPGDFNNSGKVDGADFLLWQRNFGQPGYDAAALATWKANFGSGAAVAAAGAVPEPAAFALIAMAGAALAVSRRKR